MSDQLPDPLVPAEVDLRDFKSMPLYVRRLRDSRFVSIRTPEEVLAGILLWSSSWHQVPAGSLPDDDVELSNLAGYGGHRGVSLFKKVRAGALHNFVKCSDGRLYHPVVAEAALASWWSKVKEAWRKDADRWRKAHPQTKFPDIESWNQQRLSEGIDLSFHWNGPVIPLEKRASSIGTQRTAAGIPPDSTPQRKGREGNRREVVKTLDGRDRAPGSPTRRGAVAAWLCREGVKVTSFNPELVSWIDELNATDDQLRETLERCRIEKPAPEPIPSRYFDTTLRGVLSPKPRRIPPNRQQALEARNQAVLDEWQPPEIRDAAG